ncbi:LysR family transcriptional regulator [uncultured Roseibium sp.]|uniref:LysR family transcriptional regulator n=1 Tax=uncultured Roseibium sp. TaxID=1936171 RepID=UPI003216551B
MSDWNTYHLVLTLSRAETLGAAARDLRVNETTVSRRLAAAESDEGATLFRRDGRKLVPTEAGRVLLQAAQAMETALLKQSSDRNTQTGHVRLSMVPFVLDYLIAPRLPDFCERFPGITLECAAATGTASLAQRETDISLRLARPTDGKLIIRKAMDIGLRLAVSRHYSAQSPIADFITYDSALDTLPEIAAIRSHFKGEPRLRLGTLSAVLQAVKAGAGAAMLPDWLISGDPDLIEIDPPVRATRELWIVVHEDLNDRPVIRTVLTWLSDVLGRSIIGPVPQSVP